MGIVLWHVDMSLCGFIARPGDDMGWIFDLAEPSAQVDEVVGTTGALVIGRRTLGVETTISAGDTGQITELHYGVRR